MELISYLQILQRRKWVVLITTCVAMAVAVVGHALMPVTYQTSAVVRIIPYSTGNPSYNELMYADRVMKTYLEIGSSSAIMTSLREDLGLPPDRDISVEVGIIPDTELLRITVKDRDPILATDIANALATYLINDKTFRDVRVSFMEPAMTPKPPSVLSTTAFYILANLCGVLGGFGLAFVLENVDTRLYDVEQVKNITKLPILCWLPSVSGLHSPKILADQFPYNHAFQRLSIILQNKVQERHLRTILITSPESNVGRSTVAVNLAVSLAQSGCKTLLVDADIYKPTIHKYFGLANRTGVCNFLYSGVVPKDIIQTTDIENLSVMTSGPRMENRADLIQGGKQIKKLLDNLSKQYDFVILDTPASLELADSMLLAPLVDGVLVVIRLGITRPSCLKTTCQQLGYVSANMIGVVVNDVGNMYSGKIWRGASIQKNSYVIHTLKRALVVNKVRREEQVQRSIISQKET